MQILLVFFLAFLVGCYGHSSECIDETQYCMMTKLPDITMNDPLEYASCSQLTNCIECMDEAYRYCAGGEFEDTTKEFIEEMKEKKNEKCNVEMSCYGDESECIQNAGICVADLLNVVFEDASNSRQCKEMTKSLECLEKTVVESCAGEEDEDEVKEGIEGLKAKKNRNCNFISVLSENDDLQQCFEENESYILQCIIEGTAEVLDALPEDIDAEDIPKRMECGLYMRVGECTIKRIEEKCGSEAAGEAMRIISDIPDGVKEACKSIDIGLHTGSVAEDKKKK